MANSYPDLIDRSPCGFIDALCERLQPVMRSFWHEIKTEGEYHEPVVHAQYLPVNLTANMQGDKSREYPFVLVVCTDGVISGFHPASNGSEITTDIYFGCYRDDADNQGWRLSVAMLWRVMQNLLEDKIVQGYLLQEPLSWEQFHAESPPYCHARISAKWRGSPPAAGIAGEAMQEI